jgi:hypothetical protein
MRHANVIPCRICAKTPRLKANTFRAYRQYGHRPTMLKKTLFCGTWQGREKIERRGNSREKTILPLLGLGQASAYNNYRLYIAAGRKGSELWVTDAKELRPPALAS